MAATSIRFQMVAGEFWILLMKVIQTMALVGMIFVIKWQHVVEGYVTSGFHHKQNQFVPSRNGRVARVPVHRVQELNSPSEGMRCGTGTRRKMTMENLGKETPPINTQKKENPFMNNDLRRRQYEVTIVADGKKSTITVEHGESLLNALERQNQDLSLNHIPHDCRRGNCLTCAGRVLGNSQRSLRQKENGLAPTVAKELNDNSYILTCSSHVVGDGVTVEIGLNHSAWNQIWSQRLQSEDTRQLGREASAKTIRLTAQQNIPRWKRKTEKVLKKTKSKEEL